MAHRHRIIIFCLLLAAGLASLARALDLPPPYEGAQVLPVGKSTFTFAVRHSTIDQTLGSAASTPRLLRELTWREVIAEAPEAQRPSLHSLQELRGRQDDEVLMREYVRTTGSQTALRPLWMFGLGECITVGARIPVVAEDRETSRQMTWLDSLAQATPTLSPANSLAEGPSAGAGEVTRLEGFASGRQYRIGDVEIFGQYLARKSDRWALALRPKLVLPTSPPPDPYRIDALLLNEGQTDLGLDVMWELQLTPSWTLLATEGYLAQLPDRIALRIPDQRHAILQGGLDRDVRRDAGDLWLSEVLLRYAFRPSLAFTTAYQQATRGQDEFSGQRFSASRYDWLARGSAARVELGRFGVSYSPSRKVMVLTREVRLLSAHLDVSRRLNEHSDLSDPIAELGATFAY